jgi:hypothetical protein
MSTPIIGIAGEAGSGKDTVAGFIQKYTQNSVCIAQADSMKRFAKKAFGFTEEQLWGPSEYRNAPDLRFDDRQTWALAEEALKANGDVFMEDIFGYRVPPGSFAANRLLGWFNRLFREHFSSDKTKHRTLTPRTVLQTLGTEWGRAVDPAMWSRYTIKLAKAALNGGCTYNRTYGLASNTLGGIPDFVLITDVRFPNEIINLSAEGGRCLLVVNPTALEARAAVDNAGVPGHSSEAYLKKIPYHWYTDIIVNDKSQGLLYLESQVRNYVKGLTKHNY